MKKNYAAWEIDPQEFFKCTTPEEQIHFLLRFAVLAPSTHNSQPWQFLIDEGRVTLSLVERVDLSVGDKDMRQRFIALGCALENLSIAFDYYGYITTIKIHGSGNKTKVTIDSERVTSSSKNNENHLIYAIGKRATNRSHYRTEGLSSALRHQIETCPFFNVHIAIIEDQKQRMELGDMIGEATKDAMGDISFRKELARFLRNNFTHAYDGMPGVGLGIPTLPSFIAPLLMRYFNLGKANKSDVLRTLKEATPTFIVLSTEQQSPESWINAGRTYERITLIATANNLATHPMVAPIEIGKYHERLRELIGSIHRPVFLFRIGVPKKEVVHSPRFPVNKKVIS